MTQSTRGGDRAALACATIIRNRTLASLSGPPSAAVIQRMVDEIHACCPQQTRFKCRRLAHGWTVEEAIEHFHALCDREGVKRRGLTERSWREWEAGARPDRDYTDLLCRLYETGPVQLGFAHDYTPDDLRSGPSAPPVLDLITEAADEAGAHAEEAEASELGSGALERLRTQVIWVGKRYVAEAPLPLFVEMRELQERTRRALDKRIHPGQARELYFLTGALCGLMANVSMDMDRRIPADTLARAAWTYGKVAGHAALMGWARGMQASVALWDRRYSDAAKYAEEGLTSMNVGSGATRLHMLRARSYALLGRGREAAEALRQAADVRSAGADELHDEIAGEFAFRPAKEHYYAAVTHLHLGFSAAAIESAGASLSLYASGDPENRSYGCESMASAHLAIAHLMEGDASGAEGAMAPILALPPDRRIGSLGTTLATGRALLSARPGGAHMARQIESFCAVGLPQHARQAISDRSGR
ncbi:hypothetical protein [Streptosporangium roseum]|uniref:XRE family transcriptional regulator n=1 Tax=Streptosporangium roseum (strain ATCC 12428 / DSM 43021 / JCM 3005 / KCTC 9067 / NCIMB 10171 / NRRL 2505 / NI 9100) TaxID=479432 RepID=D2BCD4_STRRD|nr:hypothetical protein [Streptosporangium roseum]ACZ89963.1 hypothetical protein Sros_7276 [Streptosporangium roseum DSM 43021]